MTRVPPRLSRRPARKRFGQHFLEPQWVLKVVAAIAPRPEERFLEIGPGRGALTAALAARCHSIVAVEIDWDLGAELTDAALPNVRVVVGDFLETPIDEWRERSRTYRVAANLPYNVATPILFRLLALARDGLLVDAVLMLQREVADRLAARPGHRTWGPLGILTQLQAEVDYVLTLPPGAFRPAPRVHSALVRLRFREDAVAVGDYPHFVHLVRGLFLHRRKTLANALREMERHSVREQPSFSASGPEAPAGRGRPKSRSVPDRYAVPFILARANLDGGRRPETLELAELARLSRSYRLA
ncbi:MAG: ribosomal RNA small subunit methyltransferase A [Luteitalea sp.]|nr:ribosomal RNA small subunit methyltransferase A [Luteitalea sp.]